MRIAILFVAIASFFLLIEMGGFVLALLADQDISCSIVSDCRVNSCGECVNKNQAEVIFCERPPVGTTSISCECESNKCGVTGKVNNLSEDGAECRNLYWFDDNNKNCSQKQFCGTYLYQGLYTFTSKSQCEKIVNF